MVKATKYVKAREKVATLCPFPSDAVLFDPFAQLKFGFLFCFHPLNLGKQHMDMGEIRNS